MADSSVLRLSVLGNLEIYHEDKPLKGFVSAKVQALLCYLVLTARAHTRDALVGLFWGDMPDADAKTNLRQAIANLRRLLEPHLLIDRETVAFNRAAPYWLDAEEFAKIADFRSQIADYNKSAISNLKSAIELYRGDFLDGFHIRDAPEFEEWVLAQRERLREQALRVLHILTTHHTTHGEYARGIDYAQQLLALDPWREEAHRELMLLYARTGQRSAALAQFETCRRVLQEQMGVEPDAATVALAERIHAARSAPPHNLPAQPTSFVGRAGDIAQIESRLLKRECRMLTLVGLGGIGKTRLALQSAEHLANIGAFLDGVFFAPLASINADSTDALVFALADACGLTLKSGDPQLQLCDYLRDKEILFVLDNFEHLLAHVGFLTQLLKRGRDVKLLVTSRERLNVQWEWLFEIAGLTAEPSAQLFSERACQVEPRFLLAENQAQVARICQLVQGMPLGIELASAWVKAHACADIAREIERTFDFLATTMRDAPDRQRSLRAVFDYSWQRVSAEEQRVFRALSVFRGGFTREAAGQVAGATVSALAGLVNKSFLQRDAAGRYAMHPAVQQFAEEKLEQSAEQAKSVRKLQAEFFAAFSAQAKQGLVSPQQSDWLRQVEAEHNNLRAVLGWTLEQGETKIAAQTAGGMWHFWYTRGYISEARQWLEAVATAARHTQLEPTDWVETLNGAAVMANAQGDYTQARALQSECLALRREL
ncbi:partial Putative HTH-type transcriptional regulator, partial [Anaerolineae bacterium]